MEKIHKQNRLVGSGADYNDGRTLAYYGQHFNGSAIYANGVRSLAHLNQYGFGKTAGASFQNCNFGVYAERMYVISQNNNMLNMNTGYRITTGHGKSITASMNTIRCLQSGMELLSNDAANQLEVADNNIIFGNASSVIPAYGIRVEENGLYNYMSNIHDNEINFYQGATNAFAGISVEAANHIAVNSNTRINMHNYKLDMYGINLDGGKNHIVSCNKITCNTIKNNSNKDQAGIFINEGEDHNIRCNFTDSTWNGIYVKGILAGSATEIKTNEMNFHQFAFHVGLSSKIMQPQSYMGNQWFSDAFDIPNGGLNTYHENFANNSFIYLVEDPAPANHLPFVNSQNPPSWFKSVFGTTDQNCDKMKDCHGSTIAINTTTPADRDVATDSVINDPYTHETLWMLRNELYRRADANPSLLLDSVINSFYNAMHFTNTDRLKDAENAKNQLSITDSVWMQYVHDKDSMVLNYLEAQNWLMSLIDSTAIADTAYLAYLLSGINASTYLIHNLRTSMDSIGWLRDSLRNQISDDAASINATVTLGEPIEENERTVNDIYLNTIAKGIYEFTPSQVELIYNIANQCPLSGGNSIFQARALYALVDITKRFNDTELCNRVGIEYKLGKPVNKAPSFKIYPNPADESITVVCSGNVNCKKTITVRDAVGKVVYTQLLPDNVKQEKIDISNINPGVYYVQIGCDEVNFIDRFVKIH